MTTQDNLCFITLQTPAGKIKVRYQFGHIADPVDIRDFDYDQKHASVGIAPKSQINLDLTEYFRPISDQMQYPSCTANACADAWEAVIIIDKVINKRMSLPYAITNTPDMSRMFLWWNGRREMSPDQSSNPESGCYNRLVVDSLARFGVATEATWPYTVQNATRRPSLKAFRESIGYTCGNYYSITGAGSTRKDALLKALSNNHPIIFGTAIEESFLSYTGGIILLPCNKIVGLHAMDIVGYNYDKRAFRVRNSWSIYWGEGGYCWMAEDYIMNHCSNAFWVITRGYA